MMKSIYEIFNELKELFGKHKLPSSIRAIELLEEIEKNKTTRDLIPSLSDLTEIDLSPALIKQINDKVENSREYSSGGIPPWYNTISGGVNLKGIILKGKCLIGANLEGACLEGADLQDCIMERAILNGACLHGANLSGASLIHAELKQVCLAYAKLLPTKICFEHGGSIIRFTPGKTQLYAAKLMGADFFMAEIDEANFIEADCGPLNTLMLKGCSHLRDTELPIVTVFRSATIKRSSFVNGVLFQADFLEAIINDSNFGCANLMKARLARTKNLDKVDFREAKLYGVYLFDAPIENTKMFWEDLRFVGEEIEGKWLKAREVYLALKKYFKSIGRYEDASAAYIKEKYMERKSYFPSEEGNKLISGRLESFLEEKSLFQKIGGIFKWIFILMLFLKLGEFRQKNVPIKRWKWFQNLLAYHSCGYGEMPSKPLILMVFTLILFTFLYMCTNSLGSCSNWYDYAIYSLRCFVTMSFNDLQPTNFWGKILSSIEGLSGIGLVSLLMFTLGRRLSGA